MNVLLLAAGYGTRMREVSRTVPKSLLPVEGGRVVIDYLVDQFLALPPALAPRRWVLVTNDLFFDSFAAWARQRGLDRLELVNDGTRCNEERLGAIGDLALALERASGDGKMASGGAGEELTSDWLVAGTDNIFTFAIAPLIEHFQLKHACVIPVLREPDPERVKKTAELHLREDGLVYDFVEKPVRPTSDLINPPLYGLTADALSLIPSFLAAGQAADSPGQFLAWLHRQRPVYGLIMAGGRHDIGNPETYRAARTALLGHPSIQS